MNLISNSTNITCPSSLTVEEEEKVIPFLRRLTDMLQENDEIISFYPGDKKKGSGLGQIVVHDRNRVESEVLPRYFNHASFASLRRQLNYFNFARVGKGRQRGATYCNENVVNLEDILRLKRRVVGSPSPSASQDKPQNKIETKICRDTNVKEPGTKTSTPNASRKVIDRTLLTENLKHSKDMKNVVSHETNLCQLGHQATKSRGRKRFNAIVPVVHLPPIKKSKPETETFPRSTLIRTKKIANAEKKKRAEHTNEILVTKNQNTESSHFASLTSSALIAFKTQSCQDYFGPKLQDVFPINKNNTLLLNQSGQYPMMESGINSNGQINEPNLDAKSSISSNEFVSKNRSPGYFKTTFPNGFNAPVPQKSMLEIPLSSIEHTPCHSSDEVTDDEDVVACEDIVACNVLLTLGCRS